MSLKGEKKIKNNKFVVIFLLLSLCIFQRSLNLYSRNMFKAIIDIFQQIGAFNSSAW